MSDLTELTDEQRAELVDVFRSSTRSPEHLAFLVAPLIARMVADAKAEALRDAADELDTTDHATETALTGIDYIIDHLRPRADEATR